MKKKGFTLIELLAVIVILAIIALIATPMILGVIEKARKGAAKASALNYIDAVEKYMVLSELDSTKYPVKLEAGQTYQVSNTTYEEIVLLDYFIEKVKAEDSTSIVLNDIIEIKGEYPTSGIITIGEKNKVAEATLITEGYIVVCENNTTCEIEGKDDSIRVTDIELSETSVTLDKGETVTITATIKPNNAVNKTIKWISADETVATVENGVITAIDGGTTTIKVTSGSVTKEVIVKVNKELICKRATTLYGFGNLGTEGELNPGDAYNCDVDNDGAYEVAETFYFLSDLESNDKYAVLIYYVNITGLSQYSPTNEPYIYGPSTAVTHLPTTADWPRVSLTNTTRNISDENGKVVKTGFSYEGKAARLPTVSEVNAACGTTIEELFISGTLEKCTFLMQNTGYTSSSYPNGYWLENVHSIDTEHAVVLGGSAKNLGYGYPVFGGNYYGVRPVIEVPKANIEI